MNRRRATLLALLVLTTPSARASDAISLAGEWGFARGEAGDPIPKSAHAARLPGSLQAQGLGDPVSTATAWTGAIRDKSWFDSPAYAPYRTPGNVKVPFWLQPETHYVGGAWYSRDIEIPASWQGRTLRLTLERAHIATEAWIDGEKIGRADSLSTPHRHEFGPLAPGRHRLAIHVDNRPIPKIGDDSHCVTDHTQTNWNGIVGAITLEPLPATRLEDLEVHPDLPGKRVKIRWSTRGAPAAGKVAFTIQPPSGPAVAAEADAAAGETVIPLGESVQTWDEFNPRLYRLAASLSAPSGHRVETTFGMVEYRVEGRRFLVNGRPTLFRGTLDCAVFPATGYPPTDVASWKKEIAAVKAHGLNHIRFHSWCPPRAAFVAADELGCYLQIEHAWTTPDKADAYLMAESERVIREFGNHPSFALHAYGNEPTKSHAWLEKWVAHFKKRDPRRLYTASSGWPITPSSDFHVIMDGLREYPWGAGLKAPINAEPPSGTADFRAKTASDPKPFVAHESGQWCVYPDFDEIPKYTGFLKANNFEIVREQLAANHMGDQARDFLMASGRLQTLCYKTEIEKLLRTPDIGGFQLLGLNDFPGQGTALVGAVNVFWETKPYTSPEEYRSFAGPTVPLVRMPKFVFAASETLAADAELAHFGEHPLPATAATWQIADRSGAVRRSGTFPARDLPVGPSPLGRIEAPLEGLPVPGQYRLRVAIPGTPAANTWDFWVYPDAPPADPGPTHVTRDPNDAFARASGGASVLLLPDPAAIVDPAGPPTVLGFSSIFWNTAWTVRQPPTTLGILCDPAHPAFAGFPTERHSTFQWWYLLRLAPKPLLLDGQDPAFRPVVQVIDDWFTNRRLGLVAETRVGKGKLVVCAIDFDKAAPGNPVARQFRASLLAYMASPAFAPAVTLDRGALAKMLKLDQPQ